MYKPLFPLYVRGVFQMTFADLNKHCSHTGYFFTPHEFVTSFGEYLAKRIDDDINDSGVSSVLRPNVDYRYLVEEVLERNHISYLALNNIYDFDEDLRFPTKYSTIWDYVMFCNRFNINIVTFGLIDRVDYKERR